MAPKLERGLAEDAWLDPVLSFDKILIGGLIRSEIPASRQNCRRREALKGGKYSDNYQVDFNFLVIAVISFFIPSLIRHY